MTLLRGQPLGPWLVSDTRYYGVKGQSAMMVVGMRDMVNQRVAFHRASTQLRAKRDPPMQTGPDRSPMQDVKAHGLPQH